jgi:hypothetical protein
MDLVGHKKNTFFVVGYDASHGWLGPIEDADNGDVRWLVLMLLRLGEEPNIEALGLVADFVERHRFGYRRRGRPRDKLRPWTIDQTRKLAIAVLKKKAPKRWRQELAEQLVNFRLIKKKGNRPPVYQRTLRDAELLCAAAEVRSLMKETGWNIENAAEHLAPFHYLRASTLLNYMSGRRGSRRHARVK